MIIEKKIGKNNYGFYYLCSCDWCGNIVEKRKYIVEHCKNHFCSNNCLNLWQKGKKLDSELVERMSKGHIGHKHSEETKAKIKKWNLEIGVYHPIGKEHPNYKNGVRIVNGYKAILSNNHPYKSKNNYVYEHRLIMEKILGRYLEHQEVVHHIDDNVSNNNPDNLMLFSNTSEHMKFHKGVYV